MPKLCTNYKGARGPPMEYKWAPPERGCIRIGHAAWLKKIWRRLMKKKMKKLW